jgi:membrane-bound ClpP family serine protease
MPPEKVAPIETHNPANDQMQQVVELTHQARDAVSATLSKEKLAFIALAIGVIGIPLAFVTFGCSLVGNIAGIILARMARRTSQRRMAAVAMALNLATVIGILIFYGMVVILAVKELTNPG